MDPYHLTLAFVVAVLCMVTFKFLTTPKKRYPPGPPAKPLIGNILEVESKCGWLKFTQYKEEYGDLVFFHGLGTNVLVLNSMKAIKDLFEDRSKNYSHRPQFTFAGKLMGLDQSMPLLPYNDEWRSQRKLAHSALNSTAITKYQGLQQNLAAMLCKNILDAPENFIAFVRLTSGQIILSITYGTSVGISQDEYVTHAEETMVIVGEAIVPGAFLCDLIPSMKYLPSWVPFQRYARRGKAMVDKMVNAPFDHVKRQMEAGSLEPSLVHHLLSLKRDDDGSNFEHSAKWTAGSLYSAAGETTYSTVLTFIMAMALNPDKQKKAQAEIDDTIGLRLPTIPDRISLPYVMAVIKETMRWHPAVPLSIARQTDSTDVYRGYYVPSQTIVIPNLWAIAFEHNEKYDPKEFIPERFTDPEDHTIDPSTYAFGFGRRMCPGKGIGENSVFAIMTCLLATFDISPPPEGIIPDFEEGLVR